MKQKITLLLLAMMTCATIMAQTITIKDEATDEPIEWATIASRALNIFETTNAKGQADISNFKDAEEITIRSLGYEIVVKSYAQLKADNFVVYLKATNLNLSEVVVSATRWKQSSSEVPNKIASIAKRDIKLQAPQTSADLLSISGKVFVQKSQQGGGSPMIRGFATNRLLYTIDGVRMNTAIFRGGNIQNVISLDAFAMESTEVLFGPGSVIYGSDAIGGVMSFNTLMPELSLGDAPLITGTATMRYSSANNEKTGHFDINVGWKKWAMVTSISHNDFDHLRQGSHGPDEYVKDYFVQRIDSVDRVVTQNDELLQIPTAYSQTNLMQKVRFKPNKRWDFTYAFHFSETSPYGRYDRHNRQRNGTARYAEWNYGPQKWMMNNLNIAHTAQNAAFDKMTLRLAQQNFGESRIDRALNSNVRATRTEAVEAYSANLDFIKKAGQRHTLFYGAEYVRNDVTSTGVDENISTGVQMPGPARYPQATWQSMAIYLNDEFMVNEKLSLQGGVRYNQFMVNSEFDTTFYPFPFTEGELNDGALTGSLGGVFRPNKSWVISANFGTAFRAPNVDDIGKVFDSEPGAVTVPNPNLKAEYAYNVDAGVAKVFGEAIKVDVTGYYTILNNAMVRRNYTLNGMDSIIYDGEMSQVQALQNAAVAHVYGVQAGLEIKLPAGFQFSTDLNWQRGEEEMDDGSTSPSRHAAPFFGVSRLTYNANKLNLQLYANYQGERSHNDLAVDERGKDEIYAHDENGNTYAPSWYTLNIKAMYQFTDLISVTAGIENITDQRYRPYSSGISGAGRNFIMAMRVHF